MAIYHFARTADDIADEGDALPHQRLAELAAYKDQLRSACQPGAEPQPVKPRWPAVFGALQTQSLRFGLPAEPLFALLDAFEQDVRNPDYTDMPQLLDYCNRSANPVGRLLLHLYGVQDAASLQRADDICSALQLINFWQDLSVDGPRGRLYVPQTVMARHGVSAAELRACIDSAPARALVRWLCEHARQLMLSGAPLALQLQGRAGWELRLVVQGGLRILEKIARSDHAALLHRPTIGAVDGPVLLWRALRMGRANPSSSSIKTRGPSA
jgi:hydroxysqualene synthase